MRFKYLNTAFFVALLLFTVACRQQYNSAEQKFIQTHVKHIPYFAGMRYIDGGNITLGLNGFQTILTKKDTALLNQVYLTNYYCAPFYMSSHEVTNIEYREFLVWVKDSMYNQFGEICTEKLVYTYADSGVLMTVPVYPDTLSYEKEFSFAKNDPMVSRYYWNREYNDFPVNAINWHQAVAYCHWRTCMANKLLSNRSKNSVLFRLPDEKEWEYAAVAQPDNKKWENVIDRRTFPWDSYYAMDNKGKWLANFWNIYDNNGVVIKNATDDNGFYPVKVGSYKPNDYQLYDMAGNVSEWTNSVASDTQAVNWWYREHPLPDSIVRFVEKCNDSVRRYCTITINDDSTSAFKKEMKRGVIDMKITDAIANYNLSKRTWLKQGPRPPQKPNHSDTLEYWEMVAKILHNQKVIAKYSPARIVKGGSWADGLVYLQCGSREVYNENTQSCKIGFRVAMDVIREK